MEIIICLMGTCVKFFGTSEIVLKGKSVIGLA